jgi:hypothetical protein
MAGACAKIGCDSLALIATHRIGDSHHRSEVESTQNAFGRHLIERRARWNSRIALFMATGTPLFVNCFTGGF